MFLLVDHAASGTSDDRPLKVNVTPELLKLFAITDKWKRIEGLYENHVNAYNRKIPGWGRMIDGRHVLVLHNYGKAWMPAWRIYLDGELIYDMLEVTNERAAKDVADVYMKSYKFQYIVKFENAMNDILQQYEKERTSGKKN